MSQNNDIFIYLGGVALAIGAAFGASELALFAKQQKWIKACNKAFFQLDDTQRSSVAHIVRDFQKYGDRDENKLIYMLATARHESRLKPIKEWRASSSQTTIYNRQNRYWHTGYFGRGFVQLTWERNYAKMAEFTGLDLVNNPDLALLPDYASDILVYGMMNGSFTRRKLDEFINKTIVDYYNARKTVNGLDKAVTIMRYAVDLQNALKNP
jgi:hypothetical protein